MPDLNIRFRGDLSDLRRKYRDAQKLHERYLHALGKDTATPFSPKAVGPAVRAVSELTKANRRLKLEQQTTRITFRELNNELRTGQISGETYKKRIDDLAAFSLPRLRKELRNVEQQLGRDSAAFDEFQQKVRAAEAQLASYQARGYAQVNPQSTRFRQQIAGGIQDATPAPARGAKLGQGLSQAGSTLLPFGTGTAGAALAAAYGSQQAVSRASTFRDSVSSLDAVVGFSETELKRLSDIALREGSEMGVNAREVIEVYQALASNIEEAQRAGVEGLTQLGRSTIELARANDIELSEAVTSVSAIINQYGLEISEADRVTNALAAGSRFGSAEVGDLGITLAKVGQTAKDTGLSLETTVAATEVLAKANIKGAEAGTALRNILLRLSDPSRLAKAGVEGVSLQADGFSKTLTRLAPLLDDTTTFVKLFGVENATAARRLLTSVDALDQLEGQVTDTTVVYDQLNGRIEKGELAFDQLNQSLDEALTRIGGVMLPMLADSAGEFSAVTREVINLGTNIGNLTTDLAGLIGLVSDAETRGVGYDLSESLGRLFSVSGLLGQLNDLLEGDTNAAQAPFRDAVAALQEKGASAAASLGADAISIALRQGAEFNRGFGIASTPYSPDIPFAGPEQLDLDALRRQVAAREAEARARKAEADKKAKEAEREAKKAERETVAFDRQIERDFQQAEREFERSRQSKDGGPVSFERAQRGSFVSTLVQRANRTAFDTVAQFDESIGRLQGQIDRGDLPLDVLDRAREVVKRLKEQRDELQKALDDQEKTLGRLVAFNSALASSAVTALSEVRSVAEGIEAIVGSVLDSLSQQLSQLLLQIAETKQAAALARGEGALSAFASGLPFVGGAIALSTIASRFFHEGGMVPGAPGADVPAVLQADEFVVNRRDTARARGGLAALNAGAPMPVVISKLLAQEPISVPVIAAKGSQVLHNGGPVSPFAGTDVRTLAKELGKVINEQKVVLPQDTFGTVQNRRARRIQQTAVRP